MTPAEALKTAATYVERLTEPANAGRRPMPWTDHPQPGRRTDEAGICHVGDAIFDTYLDAPIIIDRWDARAGTSYYDFKADTVCVVPISHFRRAKDFYAILFHEIAHSTGHPDRLNRRAVLTKPLANRGREELVAELTAAALMEYTGLADGITRTRHCDYLSNWMLSSLTQARRETNLHDAIDAVYIQAERAINWILGKHD